MPSKASSADKASVLVVDDSDLLHTSPSRPRIEVLLAGSVEHLSLADLLQILSLNGKEGLIRLQQDGRAGELAIRGGTIVHARCGRVGGAKAVHRMLGWPRATFEVLRLDPASVPVTMDAPATPTVMDGLVSLDEWNRWEHLLPARDCRIEPVPRTRGRSGPDEVSPAELDVLARAVRRPTLGQLLDESTIVDGELAEAVCTLLARGTIRAVPPPEL